MEPHTWDRIQDVYFSALPIPPGQRCDFVAQACDFDPVLTKQICSLLKAGSSTEFLEAPIFGLGLKILNRADPTELFDSSDAIDELIGSTIDDRYVVDSRLAEGGMARVYLAHDLRLDARRVVVKVLRDKSLHNEWIVRRFRGEKKALAKVDHPGVVYILDDGELPDKKPYLVEQYVAGVSLRELIAAKPEGLPFERAAFIIRGIGSALSAVHRNGIYHRDLKPENIMLQELGPAEVHVKVVDFGIAKVKELLAGRSSTDSVTMGTVAYMSPEQLRGDKAAAPSDVYSFAVVAYELLTGRRPFVADTQAHLLELQRQGIMAKPSELRPRLSGDAQDIILNGLAFEPNSRRLGAGEFGDRLSLALLTEAPSAWERVPAAAVSPAANNAAVMTTRLDSQLPSGPKANTPTQDATPGSARKSRASRWLILTAAAVLLFATTIGTYWLIAGNRDWFGRSTNSRSNPSSPHRTLSYSLTVQKMRDSQPYLEPFESSGQKIFESGDRFRLNVSSRQAGHLYVFSQGPPEQEAFTIIYPTPAKNEGSARLEQNQDLQTNWNTFTGETGNERLWIVWAATEVTALEIARYEAYKNNGAITEATATRSLRDFFSKHSTPQPETTKDMARQRTSLRADGDLLVKLLELEHR
jgi:serine/threonine protein kinase